MLSPCLHASTYGPHAQSVALWHDQLIPTSTACPRGQRPGPCCLAYCRHPAPRRQGCPGESLRALYLGESTPAASAPASRRHCGQLLLAAGLRGGPCISLGPAAQLPALPSCDARALRLWGAAGRACMPAPPALATCSVVLSDSAEVQRCSCLCGAACLAALPPAASPPMGAAPPAAPVHARHVMNIGFIE